MVSTPSFRRLAAAALLLALLVLPACGAAESLIADMVAETPDGGGSVEAMSQGERTWALEVLYLTNQVRKEAGLEPVAWHEDASRAAYAHAWDMDVRGYFSHDNPDGMDPGDRLKLFGVPWETYAENIARGQGSPSEVVSSWVNSDGHRRNLLNPDVTHVGVGVHSGPIDGPWWVQDFVR